MRPDAALVDVMLPDGNGVHLAVHLRKQFGKLPVIMMSGMVLQAEEAAICQSYNFQTLYKPFLAQDVRNMLQALLLHGSAERAKSAGAKNNGDRIGAHQHSSSVRTCLTCRCVPASLVSAYPPRLSVRT